MKAKDLTPGTRFHIGTGDVYVMEHFVQLRHETYFILRNIANGNVFESRISPDMEVYPV